MIEKTKMERNGKTYFISQKSNGLFEILESRPIGKGSVVSEAYLYCGVFLWNRIEPFTSKIQAYKFLKENINNML